MSSPRLVSSVVTAYLLVASLSILAWLSLRAGALLPPWVLLLGLVPAGLYLVLGTSKHGRSEFIGRSMACMMLTPILLLMWAASSADDFAPANSEPQAAQAHADGAVQGAALLDAAQLFGGAVATSDVPLQLGGLVLLRRGAFDDGSELSLYRFESAVHAGAYLNFLAGTRGGVPEELAARKGLRLAPNEARYVYLEQHERELLQVAAQDAAEAQARLTAQHVRAPLAGIAPVAHAAANASAPAEAEGPAPLWPFALSFCILHLCAVVGFIYWAGIRTTRVAAQAGAVPVPESRLRARLSSLEQIGVPFSFVPAERPDELALEYHFPAKSERRLRVILNIDAQEGEVRVRERSNATGAAPEDQHERDMRPIGGPRFDPTRPEAQKVWMSVVQTSILEPELLSAVPLTLREDRAELPAEYAHGLDSKQMIYVLCAVVTKSGYTWQPVFLS